MDCPFGLAVPAPPAATLLVGLLLGGGWLPAYGQADTTETTPDTAAVAPADTGEAVPSDTAETVSSDTTDAATSDTSDAAPADTTERAALPDAPTSFPPPTYGRPAIDSLPVLTPLVGLEHVVDQQPGSFLYDLGAVGWPHGWSPDGLGPHRPRLWIDGRPYNSPLTGRARFNLVPPSFLTQPGIGVDPGGAPVGVHASWRDYDSLRPLTELRFRRDSNGQKAIEVGHSQKHRLSLFGTPGLLQITAGYGGRTTDGAYEGSNLRRERRVWGRLRYQRDEWAVELSDLSSRHRIGTHSGVVPPEGSPFFSIYLLPRCGGCSQGAGASRRTFRNDLTARVRAPLLPSDADPIDASVTWTSNTFDFQTGSPSDTTWTVKMNGGHGRLQQSLELGAHALTLGAQGSLWNVARSNVSTVTGTRWSAHAFARDSLDLWETELVLDAGWHTTRNQQYPSGSVQLSRPFGPFRLSTSASVSGQRLSWFETKGFPTFVRPLSDVSPAPSGHVHRGRLGLEFHTGAVDLQVEGFGHQIRNAVDLYAAPPAPDQRVASTDSVLALQTPTPVRRAGATATIGWRRDASRGLYLSGSATALQTLNAGASRLHSRLAQTLPRVYGKGRIGARFVFFTDLVTDLYVQARGWTSMNSRWFHPPTGRLAVPPATNVVPARGPQFQPGPNGTVDVHAEIKLRGATLFFTFENVQSSFAPPGSIQRQATLQPGTFVVPVYPLPARQFRFGVHWPIFD